MVVPPASIQAGKVGSSARFAKAVRGQLSDVAVSLLVKTAGPGAQTLESRVSLARRLTRELGAFVVFWGDRPMPTRLFFWVAAEKEQGGGLFVRRVNENIGSEGGYEALAIIVRACLTAILAKGKVGERIEPRPKKGGRSPKRGPKNKGFSAPVLGSGAGYVLEAARSGPGMTHGLAISVLVRLHPNMTLFVEYRVATPIRGSEERTDWEIKRHPLSLGVRLFWPFGRLRLGGQLALVLDVARTEIATDIHMGPFIQKRTDLEVSTMPGLFADLLLLWRLRVFVIAGMEVFCNRVKHLAQGPQGRRVAVTQSPIQPLLTTGIVMDFW